jgi:putative ABC transport system permease protein
MTALLRVDHDYIPTFGMKMAAGRNFRRDMPTDATKAFIINETAVKQLGISAEQAVGKGFEYGAQKGFVIGVVKDFHFESLHQSIAPIVMKISSHSLNQIAIRIAGNIPNTMAFLQKQWKKYRSNYPFTFEFIDERLARQYTSEMKLRKLFFLFSLIGIVIACLGLLGLSIYSAERRFKEIGIRKVLGATVPGIILLISRGFTKWVLVANLIAWPAAYFVMNMWLKNFAYRITISIWVFILSGLIAFIIALLTVSYQSIRAATANPVEALRYE